MSVTYRIYTEDKNRKGIVSTVTKSFDGFTILLANGYWKGQPEASIVIEIITPCNGSSRIDLKERNRSSRMKRPKPKGSGSKPKAGGSLGLPERRQINMMSLTQIREESARQGRKAARLHKKPYLFEEEDRNTFPPFPFPNIGDYRPKGWELTEWFMVDKTGFGDDDEPALTTKQLLRRLKAGKGYAIIEEGEFQLVLGEFDKIEKPKNPEHITYAAKGHVICSKCGECITCGIRPCRNGECHIIPKKRVPVVKAVLACIAWIEFSPYC